MGQKMNFLTIENFYNNDMQQISDVYMHGIQSIRLVSY